jgi:fatty-acyl-CoA synthase
MARLTIPTSWTNTPRSLLGRIARHAADRADAPALVFLSDTEPAVALSWAQLAQRVERLGRGLVRDGVAPGDVLFVLSASPCEQALGFLAAMAAGALPSILSFPSTKQSKARFHETLAPITRSTGARWIVASAEMAGLVAEADLPARCLTLPGVPDVAELDGDGGDGAEDSADGGAALPAPAPAFLQFSSGTTGLRKCVRISGEMLASQVDAYRRALALSADDRVVSWLPLYHDMGLVACFLVPLFEGNLSVHLSPFEWVKEPVSLFRAVSTYQGTLAWLPNFAYKLCADQITGEQLTGLAVGSLRALINCSEPVRHTAHERLLERLGPLGVRAEHLQACYAMAEATFAVTQTEPGTPVRLDRVAAGPFAAEHRATPAPPDAPASEVLTFVSCGRAIDGVEVAIDGGEERTVGEIRLRGAGVIAGYGPDGQQRGDAFTADGWYRTGDLGYLSEGELFVTGRAKELIIHRGSNVYPGDIEEVVEVIDGVKPGRAVAFGVYDEAAGTEEIAVMVEPDGQVDRAALRRQVREEIWLRLNVAVTEVDVCEPGTLVKSTSGKLSRPGNRALYLQQREPGADAGGRAPRRPRPELPHEYVAPFDLWERQLAWIWEDVLEVAPIGIEDNLFLELAADSFSTARAAAEVQRRLGRAIEPIVLLGLDTIARQAAHLRDQDGQQASPLVALRRGGKGLDLFLVHASGGWAFPYVTLARHLGDDRNIHAFQAPQLHHGDPSQLTVESMADDYIAAMKAVRPHGPYLIGGWSFGGLVAFEMAARLRAAGDEVRRVILFDTTPPSATERFKRQVMVPLIGRLFRVSLRFPWLRRLLPPLRQVEQLSPMWRFFAAYLLTGEEVNLAPALQFAFSELCDRERLATLEADAAWDYLLELGFSRPPPADRLLLIPGLDGVSVRRALRVVKRFDQLNQLYRPAGKAPVDVDIVAVRGNPVLEGWRRFVGGRLVIHPFDVQTCLVNAHWDMMEEPNVLRFAPALRQMLAEMDTAQPA